MAPKSDNKAKTVLITRFSAVGDVAMTIPLLYSLCASYPRHRFIFVSRKRFGQFFINKPENLDFIGINLDEYKGLHGLYRLYRKLSEQKPDMLADLHDVLRTKILRKYFSFFGRIKVKGINKGRKEKKALTKPGSNKSALKSTFERYRDVFTRLDLHFEPNFTSLFKEGKGNIDDFATIIPAKGNDRWVGIAPFARHNGKIYPLDKMEQVVALLSKQKNIKLFFFGNGPKEESVINDWCSKYPNTISFIGKSNFNGELRLISHLDAMICMDSANMHMASLTGTPAISIWGATSPLAGFLGWRQKGEDCIELPLECRPCSIFGNKPCRFGDYRCMDIAPQTVADRVIARIKKSNTQETL
ncbi:MAG: glycosyltransferase family 9 protein [Bacteroidaceae bacterium]|nr:glycosyltransferase family 9 protein [Bacteroidaceae bacterium]